MFSPEILVFLFFMITDPKTVPDSRPTRRAFGAAIGLLAVLLIAPQTTEFATKVAVLAALALVCAARPSIELVLSAEWTRPAVDRAPTDTLRRARGRGRGHGGRRGRRDGPRLRRRARGGAERGRGRRAHSVERRAPGGPDPALARGRHPAGPRRRRADRAGDPRVARRPRRRGRPCRRDPRAGRGTGSADRRRHAVRVTTAALRAHVRALAPGRRLHRGARAGRVDPAIVARHRAAGPVEPDGLRGAAAARRRRRGGPAVPARGLPLLRQLDGRAGDDGRGALLARLRRRRMARPVRGQLVRRAGRRPAGGKRATSAQRPLPQRGRDVHRRQPRLGANLALRGNGCVAADVDLDGHTDLYVTSTTYDALLWNRGDGTFSEIAAAGGHRRVRLARAARPWAT